MDSRKPPPPEVVGSLEFQHVEQPAAPDAFPNIDLHALDRWRRRVYGSYESYLRGRLAELDAARPSRWNRDYSSVDAYVRSVEPMRRRLSEMFGWWVEPAERKAVERLDLEALMEDDTFTARRFAIEVLPGLYSYAVELLPRSAGPHPGLLVQHGYAGTPEAACGIGPDVNTPDYSYRSIGLRAVRRGYHVVAVHHPTSYGAPTLMATMPLPGFEPFGYTYGKNRLHRLATLAGKTLFGLDLMASSRGVDLLVAAGIPPRSIGMYGLSQGGQTAMYLPAIDSRIHASVASAYFNDRLRKMVGPVRGTAFLDTTAEDKFFTGVIGEFADSDVVSLVAPRAFAAESGLHDAAVDIELAAAEIRRAQQHFERLGCPQRCAFIPHDQGHVAATARAFGFLAENLQP